MSHPPPGPGLDDFDTCKERSRALTCALRSSGVDARWVQVAGMVADAPGCDPRWRAVPPPARIHYVTVVDGTVIDLAPRQFWPEDPSPLRCARYLDRWSQHHDITSAL